MLKRRGCFLFFAFFCLGLMGACSDKRSTEGVAPSARATVLAPTSDAMHTPFSDSHVSIGVLIYKYDDTYISSVRQALEKEGNGQQSVTLKMMDGRGSQQVQEAQIESLIKQKVDVLVVNFVDVTAAQAVFEQAKSAGIPVVVFNREPPEDVMKSYDRARYVGTVPSEAGVLQGKLILDAWKHNPYDKNHDGKIQYIMLKGDDGNIEAEARTKYSIQTVNEGGVETEQLADTMCAWDASQAFTEVSKLLAQFGDSIECIVSNNDDMAIGAIKALQSNGYNDGSAKYVPVFGVDATREAQSLIKNGQMTGTVLQDADGMAKAIFAMAQNAALKKDFLEGTAYQYDDTGYAVRVPYLPFIK